MPQRALILAVCLVFAGAMVSDMARAERLHVDGPFVSAELVMTTYQVSGDSLQDLERQMQRRGPQGYWGLTRTSWNWDARCNMTFRARVTMPKLVGRERLDVAELAEWDRMVDALWTHEMGHVEIGKAWAAAIKAAGCRGVDAIDRAWRNRDAEYDRETDRGQRDGVYLRRP